MPETAKAEFACTSCGKKYPWKQQFAGRKVRCKCGHVMLAPAQAPAAALPKKPEDEAPDFDAMYSLADEGHAAVYEAPSIRCPSCQNSLEAGATVCAQCGFNLKTGRRGRSAAAMSVGSGDALRGGAAVAAPAVQGGAAAAFQAYGTPRRGLQQIETTDNQLMDLYLPAASLVAGIILSFLEWTKFNSHFYPDGQAIQIVVVDALLGVTLLVIACLFIMRFLDAAFGAPGPAALKIAAIAIAPAAFARIIDYLLNDPFGVVGFFLAFGLFFAMFFYFFDMEYGDIWVLAGLTLGVRMFVSPFLAVLLLAGMGVPGFSNIGRGVTSNDDKVVSDFVELGKLKGATDWLGESKNRLVGDLPRGDSEKIISDLGELCGSGEESLMVLPSGPYGVAVIAKLPTNTNKRKAVFDWESQMTARIKFPMVKDAGQKYLLLRFGYFVEPDLGF